MRERLFRMLDRARAHPVIWIEAPPGAGKTVLVASWLRARRLRALWYTLDESDDVASVLGALREATRLGSSRRGSHVPTFRQEHLLTVGRYARQFFRALQERARSPHIVVLDDYQAVRADSLLHRVLEEAASETRAGATLIVLSRSGPPRQFARLRATGSVDAIPAAALGLTRTEARMVARLRGGPLPDRVLSLAGGWAAGVVLLALAGDGSAAVAAARRSVFDYLAEEFFDRAAAGTREVLLRTCLLPTVNGQVAIELSGIADAPDVLGELGRSGSFIERTHGTPPAWRLHALFREFLTARAREALGADGFAALARHSSAALLGAGDIDGAAQILARCGLWDELVAILVEHTPRLIGAGRGEAVRHWLEAIPETRARGLPWVTFWRGVSTFVEDPEAAIATVETAHQVFLTAGDAAGIWRSWATVVDLHIQALDDLRTLGRWLDALPGLRQRFPIPDPTTEAAVVGAALSAYSNVRSGDPALVEWEDRAVEIALAPGDPAVRMDVGRHLAFRNAYWGADLVRGKMTLEALRPIATAPDADPVHAVMWHFGEANYHAHVGEGTLALASADRGLAIAARSGIHVWDPILRAVRIYGALALEDFASVERDLRVIAETPSRGGRLAACSHQYTAAAVSLRRGEWGEALARARAALRLAESGGHPFACAAAQIVWAAAAARGAGDGPTLREADAAARQAGYLVGEFGVCLLQAGAALETRSEADAEQLLRRAFALARRVGVTNSVYVSRAAMAELCAFALERGIEPELARSIVLSRGLAPGPRARLLPAWPWSIRIEAIGGMSVQGAGVEQARGRAQKKPLELLRLLVAHGEPGATLDRLAEELWPEAEGDVAHHALETTLYRLRHLLNTPAAIVVREGRAMLDPGRVFVDTWAIESLARRVEELRSRADVEGARRLAAAARSLCRGDVFAGEEDPRLVRYGERLRRQVEWLGTV